GLGAKRRLRCAAHAFSDHRPQGRSRHPPRTRRDLRLTLPGGPRPSPERYAAGLADRRAYAANISSHLTSCTRDCPAPTFMSTGSPSLKMIIVGMARTL